MKVPRLLVLTDRRQLPAGRDLVETIQTCASAGATTVVLREIDLTEPERATLVDELGRHLEVISARTALSGASGVQLAAHQSPGDAAGLPHGRSCHDVSEVARAVAQGASYVTVSPVAATISKPGYGPPLGIDGVRRALTAADGVPLLALGGVDVSHVAHLRVAGAYGVALMGPVMRAEDPAAVVRSVLTELRRI